MLPRFATNVSPILPHLLLIIRTGFLISSHLSTKKKLGKPNWYDDLTIEASTHVEEGKNEEAEVEGGEDSSPAP
ncbi:hypothetical protein LIER_38961 [Lithospermum erythrorhizon]|uniref:Uncharacterized protein n=1 Tax=Lithospermum erythrorhizon TaxID=34254 RepID=A0AAV3Q8Y0_LITER